MSRAELLDLSHIVFIGRTFDEYKSMFNLTDEELIGREILDCPAGACSFTAKANELGAHVTATDIAYHHPVNQLEEHGRQDLEHAMSKVESVKTNYVWDFFKNIDGLKSHRANALNDCVADMKSYPQHYVPAVLPTLPFDDKQFDLTLSAHFLFTYADKLDYKFHLKTIQELMRVTKQEIRIFPLVDGSCRRYEHLDGLINYIHGQGYTTEEIHVPYEFQKGANSMLKIVKLRG